MKKKAKSYMRAERAALAAALCFALLCAFFTGCIPSLPEPAAPTEAAAPATPEPSPVPPTETPVPWREGDIVYELFSDSGTVHSLGLGVPVIDYNYSVPAFVPSVADSEALNREILALFDNYIRKDGERNYVISSYKIGIRSEFAALSPDFVSGLDQKHVTASFGWESALVSGLFRLCVTAERITPSDTAPQLVQRSFCIDAASGRRLSFDEILGAAELTHSDFYTLVCDALTTACTESWESAEDRAIALSEAQMRTLSANTVSGIAQQGLYFTADGMLRFLASVANGAGGFDQTLVTVDPADKPIPTPEPTEEPTPEPSWEPTEEPTEEPTAEPTIEPGPLPTAIPSVSALEFFDLVHGLSAETPRELGLLASMIPEMELVYSFEDTAVRYEKSGLEFGCDLNATESPALFANITGSSELNLFGVGIGTERSVAEARLWGFVPAEGPDGSVTYDLGERGQLKLVYSDGAVASLSYLRYNDQYKHRS